MGLLINISKLCYNNFIEDFNAYKGLGRKKARDILFKQQHGKCYYCKKDCHQNYICNSIEERNLFFVIDHKVSVADNGSNMLSNLVGSCWLCNELKGKKSIY